MGMGIWGLTQLASVVAIIMFVRALYEQFYLMSPHSQISFFELSGEPLEQSETYTVIQTYLGANSSERAKVVEDSQTPVIFGIDDNEEITDDFKGVEIWWSANSTIPTAQEFSGRPNSDVIRYLTLTFDKRHGDLITTSYIQHVLEQGKPIAQKKRQLNHTTFEHPARFETLAMEPEKKEEIINDLVKFKKGKEYYAKVGKAWKRGYLVYGPPGTGKSTMISAIANFMNYDVYDLQLTIVKDNYELKRLLIETSSKSIIVIDDIDCSLDFTGQRMKKKEKGHNDEEKDILFKKSEEDEDKDEEEEINKRKVTHSGLKDHNFTTNFVDKLDPALIRRGRMDMHIEMSYCSYQVFKMLAKNYLDVESHDDLFPIIEKLLGETNMTPADVAENLMPKTIIEDVETCVKNLIQSLEISKKKEKEDAKKKTEKAQLKADKDKQQLAQEDEKVEEATEIFEEKVEEASEKYEEDFLII
ncbi:P-loop nucleoside triphosphate hydrolase superfamily protein, putative [Medicago truncatula]|uniref:P-loop nucleoside triphosphate hydrolase superfamily protein, putative n=1 Tax=Medicago truncatula TaxID=3880 RepID=G7KKD8_MEDTR|nr:P-loop nucleoside triphosphate hydrolase superfamily protein, putative [Medicago truncatula]